MNATFCLYLFVTMATIYLTINAADPNDPGYNGLGEVCYKRARKNPSLSNCLCYCKLTSKGYFPKTCEQFEGKWQEACNACRKKYKNTGCSEHGSESGL